MEDIKMNDYFLIKQKEIYRENKILTNTLNYIVSAHPYEYQNFSDMVKTIQKQARIALIKTGDLEIG